jgi:SAM-dependent methyltransferase
MNRKKMLLSMFDSAGKGLEIGPSFNPLVPKSEGYNVEILDHSSAEGLKTKYANAPNVDTNLIEEVDYISDGGSMLKVINMTGHYDYIVASHVIEHTTDLLGFLTECQTLLKENGVLVLAVPDKRFAFDCLRPVSTTGQVIQAHIEKRQRHTAGQLFDELAYNCLRNGNGAWDKLDDSPLTFFRELGNANEAYNAITKSGHFVDIHAWQFTPTSFRQTIEDLFLISALRLRELEFAETSSYEFFITLSTLGKGPQLDRITLAQRTVSEQKQICVTA